jgi:hypothetical protein
MEPVGVGVGSSWLFERREYEIWSFEKPRTMLVALTSVPVDSLPVRGGLMSEKSLRGSVATVEVEESRTRGGVGFVGGKLGWDVESCWVL